MAKRALFLIVISFFTMSLQAQDIESANEFQTELKTELKTQSNEHSVVEPKEYDPQMSLASEETADNLLAIAPFTQVAPGICLVISDMLAGFCENNPRDMSCQFQ